MMMMMTMTMMTMGMMMVIQQRGRNSSIARKPPHGLETHGQDGKGGASSLSVAGVFLVVVLYSVLVPLPRYRRVPAMVGDVVLDLLLPLGMFRQHAVYSAADELVRATNTRRKRDCQPVILHTHSPERAESTQRGTYLVNFARLLLDHSIALGDPPIGPLLA